MKASSGEIQILSETNQALDFIVTLLVKPGDSVVMEEPVHPDMYRVMELAGARILTVPVDEDGMNCDVLESLLTQTRPRLIFVNSSFHDPTGCILSLERRKKLVELSSRYRIPIVEEDAASELVYDGDKLPPIKAFDTTGNVIYIYSFSLTFIPGLSLAFVTGNRDFVRALSYLVSVRLMASDWMTQKLLGMYLDDGSYYSSLATFREIYSGNRDLVCQKLDALAHLGAMKGRGAACTSGAACRTAWTASTLSTAPTIWALRSFRGTCFTPIKTADATISASITPTNRASVWHAAWTCCTKRWKKSWRSNWHIKLQNH